MAGVLVHEWIARTGGTENVMEVLARAYPSSDIVCLWNDSEGRFDPARVRETWLARTPLRRSKPLVLPFLPTTWRHRPNRDYDWVLMNSHLFAHHARFVGADIPRFAYVHSPARYIWTPEFDARGSSLPIRLLGAPFKPIDRRRAQESGASYAGNSKFVSQRIADTWDIDARVVYPPVDVAGIQTHDDWAEQLDGADHAQLDALPEGFVLGASRFIPYKQLDTVIRTGGLLGLPVVLAGNGPELPRLQAIAASATVPVHIVISPSHALLRALYQRAALYVFPAIEDFGIMPVEAMAAGAAVLVPTVGGATETVADGVAGAHVDFSSDSEIIAGAARALATSVAGRRARAVQFGEERFIDDIRAWVGE